ncbi:hypothetical protein M4914_10965 [Streptomyces somaliensis DSM 40738]|uniref:hypothetical protein n=1 Tax=Streptomyces somaliensis TaxID=78355 RepID=UPI0021C2990E|nr:hypothetical protein [Streptomyces somaliensis]MCQ0023419.1 hypothetical protein [Streptomyces somaliensis DSM 40738]
MEAVLPPGKKITQTAKPGVGSRRCYVYVDDEEVLASATEWAEKGTSLRKFAEGMYGIKPSDKVTADGKYLYSATGAIGLVKCPAPDFKQTESDLFAWIRTGGDPVNESDIQSLIRAYTEAASSSVACREDI